MTKIIRLHDYQSGIVLSLMEAWQNHKSVMMQMPTGTGKTHVLAAVVKDFIAHNGGFVWIIAHRRELVAQIEETIGKYNIRGKDGNVRVMSIQWLSLHIDEIRERPRLVIIDEAHHAQAKTYRMLWEKCPQAKFLGLTATPCRMNRSGFTDLFATLITSWSIAEFIEKGWLSSFDYVSIRVNSLEQRLIDGLEKRDPDGDYQIKEMNEVLNRRPSIERLYESVRNYAAHKKGIVYAVSIDHARRIAEYYNNKGIYSVAIDSKTPVSDRKRWVEDFRRGAIQVLVNVDVFSEGFDCPDVEFVQMARPTLSLAKYLQQVGRGLRMSKGKEACVLIDNVGLYRVFGLPTVAWNWDAMFHGDVSGKGVRMIEKTESRMSLDLPEVTSRGCDMELIVSHDQLLSNLSLYNDIPTVSPQKKSKLNAWADEATGLWGLRVGRKKITEAVFTAVFDIRYDWSAVKMNDRRTCGLVDNTGKIVWKQQDCQSMEFIRNYFLTVRTRNGKMLYLDLHNMQTYNEQPEVKHFGRVELLKVGRVYYSRTREVYENHQNISGQYITIHKSYITILDSHAPDVCNLPASDAYKCGYACIFNHDYDCFYWVYRWLADDSLIVTDSKGRCFHARGDKEKEYIGCLYSVQDRTECMTKIERIIKQVEDMRLIKELREKKKKQKVLDSFNEAVPFRSGMKWGLKVDGRITVPPVYRNIKLPVGRYCAVEKNYNQWGVIALDGTLMVEPQYQDIEISVQGTVTGTKVTGSKVSVKLP